MSCTRLVEAVTRLDDGVAEIWCNSILLSALTESIQQAHYHEIVLRLLYTFSSNINGLSAITKDFIPIFKYVEKCMDFVIEDEPQLTPLVTNNNVLRAMIPVVDAVLSSVTPKQALTYLSECPNFVPSILDINLACACQDSNEDEKVQQSISGIRSDMRIFLRDLIEIIVDHVTAHPTRSDWSKKVELYWLYALEHDEAYQNSNKNGISFTSDDDNDVDSPRHNIKYRSVTVAHRSAFVNCVLGQDRSQLYRSQLIQLGNQLHLTSLIEFLNNEF